MLEITTNNTKISLKDIAIIASILFSVGYSYSTLDSISEKQKRMEDKLDRITETHYKFVEKVYELIKK